MKLIASTAILIVAALCSLAPAQELSQRDQLHAAVQKICPVSGGPLEEHGPPIKVKVGEQFIFVCCRGCLQGKINPEHWATIHANYKTAQQICPIMKKPLPKNSKWTIVEGQIVYVCCPPCIDKIKADPATHLRAIDSLYSASLRNQVRR
jgi:hypothetical protein